MCGIAGIISVDEERTAPLEIAQVTQAHRGPDAAIIRRERRGRLCVGLAHRRLSIIDLRDVANQPLDSVSGESAIIYNGEVYNYRELRPELEALGHQFRTDSDTEVILAGLEEWGPEEALNRFNGMWAFAWLDRRNERLVLARDRAGIKPLHYHLHEGALYFASEAKTIAAMAPHRFELDAQVVGECLLQSIQESMPRSFFRGIERLPQGCWASIDLRAETPAIEIRRYWSAPRDVPELGNEADLIECVRSTFIDSVKLRLRSDVPVGVLLSGGVDSSAIAAAMHHLLGPDANLNILSAVSRDPRFDESPFIDRMAAHLGRPVHKVMLDFTAEEAFRLLDDVTWFMDEPIGAFSNVAHFLLMKKARDLGITVILSGQGADELLCGYKKYLGFYLEDLVRHGHPLKALNVASGFYRQKTVLPQFKINEAKRYMPSFLRPRQEDFRGPALRDYEPLAVGLNGFDLRSRQRADFDRFSIPMLTHYEDRMSMAWSREVRVPFLDYRLISLLLPLDPDFKMRDGWTKYIFRKAVEPMLPPEIVWRKDKQGFINPEGEWLKTRLRQPIRDLLTPDAHIFRKGFVDRATFLRMFDHYCAQPAGKGRYWFKEIFNPLALEVFLRRFEAYLQ